MWVRNSPTSNCNHPPRGDHRLRRCRHTPEPAPLRHVPWGVVQQGNQVGAGFSGVRIWLGLVSRCVDKVLGVWVRAALGRAEAAATPTPSLSISPFVSPSKHSKSVELFSHGGFGYRLVDHFRLSPHSSKACSKIPGHPRLL